MRNTTKDLNEELIKMRKLMDFDISENSHDVLSESNVEESILEEDYGDKKRRKRQRKSRKSVRKSNRKNKRKDKKANRLIKFRKGSEFDVDISKNYNRYKNIGITLSKGKGEEVEFDGEYKTDGIGDTDRFDIENFDPNAITGENWIEIIKRSDLYQDVSNMMKN